MRYISPVLTFAGQTPPVSPEQAVTILKTISGYERPGRYSDFVSSIPEDTADADAVSGAIVAFSDHPLRASDTTEAEADIFRATYDSDTVSIEFKSRLESVGFFVELLDRISELTDIQVGIKNSAGESLTVDAVTDLSVGIEDIDAPSGWTVMTTPTDSGTSISLLPLRGFVLEGSADPLADNIENIRAVLEAFETTVEQQNKNESTDEGIRDPAGDSPTDPIEEFYQATTTPKFDTEEQMLEFIHRLAHSAGFFARLNQVEQKDDTGLASLNVSVVERDPDLSELTAWLAEEPKSTPVVDRSVLESVTTLGDVAIVSVSLVIETNGAQSERTREHLVATEYGDWKLLR